MKIRILIALMVSNAFCNQMVDDVLFKLQKKAPYTVENTEETTEYTLKDIKWNDKSTPLSISLLGNNTLNTDRVVFLLAAGNSGLEFFTNETVSLAHFYRENGYFVVTITPRVDNVDSVTKKLRRWGINRRVKDANKVIKRVRKVIDLDYTVMGFSYGGFTALSYSAEHPHERLIETHVLGIDSYDDSISVALANGLYNDAIDSIDAGVYVDYGTAGLKDSVLGAATYPDLDSGEPRGDGTNFTLGALLTVALIYPDPADPFLNANASGFWNYNPDPLLDTYGFDHFDVNTLAEGASKFGSALIPYALVRDFYSLDAVDLEAITSKVIYVNAELGYGDYQYWCDVIEDCSKEIVPSYGHIDLILGRNAFEAWEYFAD